jgi:putative ABC transport system ATP-binding protein
MDEDGRAALRRDGVGFVFQSFNLIPALTALENVMAPLELQRRGDARERAAAFLDTVGLSHRLSHTPSRLSGGEQQRVAIARAFAGGPKLVFADEPTGNLDQETGRKVIDLLLGINRDQGTTLVLVTHDPALAERCSRRLQLQGGQVVGGGSEDITAENTEVTER